MITLGVDVSVARGLDLVFLDGERRLVGTPLRRQTPDDLGRVLRERRPDVVAIDSPPAFGTSGSCRSCERGLLGLGISLYATPSDPEKTRNTFYDWMRAGHAAFAAARDAGYATFAGGASVRGCALEVFPHASAVALAGSLPPHGADKRRWRTGILERAGVDTTSLRTSDQVDAALAALTGIFALRSEFWTAGAPGEPVIVVPGTRPTRRFARETAPLPIPVRGDDRLTRHLGDVYARLERAADSDADAWWLKLTVLVRTRCVKPHAPAAWHRSFGAGRPSCPRRRLRPRRRISHGSVPARRLHLQRARRRQILRRRVPEREGLGLLHVPAQRLRRT